MSEETETFRKLADSIGDIDAYLPHLSQEPWPDWLRKVIARMGRNYTPHMNPESYQNNHSWVSGQIAGVHFILGRLVQEGALQKDIPDKPALAPIVNMLNGLQGQEFLKVKETVAAALDLPLQDALSFFQGFNDGVSEKTIENLFVRLSDNHTVRICFFLASMRPLIEAKKVRNIAELLEVYHKISKASGDLFFEENPAAKESFNRQFRNICSEDGVKIAGRGRPRKNTSDKPSTA